MRSGSQTKNTSDDLRLFRYLIDQTSDAIFVIDPETGRFLDFNDTACNLLGYSRDELTRMGVCDVSRDMPEFASWATHVEEIKRRGSVILEDWLLRKGGAAFPAEISVRYAPVDNGLYMVAVVRNISERKKAEETLRESEEKYRNLFDSSADGIYKTDANGIFTLINQAGAEHLGFKTPEEVIGRSAVEFWLNPEDRVAFITELKKKKRVRSYHILGKRVTGETTHADLTSWIIEDSDGNFLGIEGIVWDVTDRKRMEKALDREKRISDTTIESLPGIFYLFDEHGKFLKWNSNLERISGYSAEEISNMHPLDFFAGEDRQIEEEHIQNVFQKVGPSTSEAEITSRDGRRLPFLFTYMMVTIEGIRCAIGTGIDITDRKNMEEESLLTKRDWEDTFDTLIDMITVHDKDFNIIRANKAAEKILLLPLLEKTADAKCFKYYHGTEKPPAGCPSCSCLQTGKPATFELFEPYLNMFIEIRAIPRLDSSNNIVGLIHVVRDITERKKAEDRIQRQLQKLSALRSIDLAISSSLDIRVTLRIFIEHAITQLGVDAADVLLLNPHTRILEYATGQGFRTDALKHSHLRLGEGYAGAAALENRIVSVSDLKGEDSAFKRLGLLEGEDFITYYGVPLVAKGHVKGVLEIFHRSSLKPDEEWFEFLNALALQGAIAIDNNSLFYDLERSNMELTLAYDSTIEGWSDALDYKDKETEGHSQRVTEMTLRIAREMGMSEEELVHVRRGALLHDIGKMGIPDSILLKPGSLNKEEWKIMHRHPVYSFELLSKIIYLKPALDIPYCHHEKWDGSGYPRGLKGEQIPFSARIFAVVDVWDALRSDRPYRPAWSEEKAREYILSLSGIQFDPKVVETFLRTISEKKD